MKENFKTAAAVITAVLIAAFFTGCQQDDEVVAAGSTTVSSAKEWFKEYEGKGDNYVYLQNLIYDWPGAIVKQAEDGTETIVIPIKELKINQSEIWQQRLYLYKLPDGSYKASVVEIYPDKAAPQEDQSMEGGNFNGYISVWDLKKGFVKAAQFKNNHAVEDGIVEVLDREDKATYKALPMPCEDCMSGGGSNTTGTVLGDRLRSVVVIGKSGNSTGNFSSYYYSPRSPVVSSGFTPDSYTSNRGGSGDSSPGLPPATVVNPCDKMKTLMANPNFIVKLEELLKKTNLKVENGYSQSKNGPFTPLTGTASTENSDQIRFASDANTVGYIHTHLDPYERVNAAGETQSVKPIKMFSPGDVKAFVILLLNASRNNIPIDNIYGTMVSSSATYQLRFTGNINDVILKGGSINWNGLDVLYTELMSNNSIEKGFLKFLNEQIGINGIELYKIEASGNSRKTLNNNGKVSTINCN
ncbi:hypothetical protein GJU43_09845 [Flavobacterium sp. LC2016-23]|uniref:hypothetical protein n=1 Tax=Flavobacterium sp. LC2016-23 TaxID=2666330 RepID=UPI0012AF2389|nr:hypothetical protein [Flavobacterium sp. LC2016-23]MRX39578.1 hypothetical protein [Flavobacterium sp. LC2016-23]